MTRRYANGDPVPACMHERQARLRAMREAEGYYTPESVAAREEAARKRAEYNARIFGTVPDAR